MSREDISTTDANPEPSGPFCKDPAALCLQPTCTLREVIDCLDKTSKGIVLVTDSAAKLVGTMTDGDVRRWLLAGGSLSVPISEVLPRTKSSLYTKPVTALAGASRAALLHLMQETGVHQIPILNKEGAVLDLVVMGDLLPRDRLPMQAVIMAGGFGTRLRPLTLDIPKPMVPVGDRPLMELIVRQLQAAGIRRVNVTTHYKPEKIVDHFGNGDRFGVEFNYLAEDRPLGTAGALGLLDQPEERLLVMNGDILTNVDFHAMLDHHQEHSAALTIGVRKYEFKIPYGVIESEGADVRRVVEKPTHEFFVNAGIYVLEPIAHQFIPRGQRFDMTDLISVLIQNNHRVACFPILEYWLDIGQHVDYEKALQDVQTGRFAA